LIKRVFILPVIGASLSLILNWLWLRDTGLLFTLVNFFAGLSLLLPFALERYIAHRRIKELEDQFPIFLADFVETVRGGMPIPEAFKSVARNDYKSLSKHVRKVATWLGWGMPVDDALLRFGHATGSEFIMRMISSVIESHRHGGPLADTFEALSKTALEIEKIRTERRIYMYSQILTGYIVFFVFLGVMVGLYLYLIPSLIVSPALPGVEVPPGMAEALAMQYRDLFRNLILIQGFFAGLTVGKLSEGAIIAGLKHSLFMMCAGFLTFVLITA
jgi:flagellar protein FlaJ